MNAPLPTISLRTSLHVDGLSFGYPHRRLFNAMSIHFEPGFTWITGGNGSGKSTLLKLIAGALEPQAGQILLQDVSQTQQPLEYRRQVFWCGPGPLPFDHLTPYEYFGFMLGLYPGLDLRALAAHITGFGLDPHLGALLRTLSTGTQRKVWLAAALSVNTPVRLLDEPLNALDTASLEHLRCSLADAAQQADPAIWLIASHDSFGAAGANARILAIDTPNT